MRNVDWVLVTHDHIDHFDRDAVRWLARASSRLSVLVPSPVAETARKLRGVNVVPVQPGDEVRLSPGVVVEVLPAWHGNRPEDGYSQGRGADGLVRFVGYLVKGPGASVYHPGDTIVTDGLREALSGKPVDVALFPINGRDYYREARGLVGNMDAREAVQLASELGARILVPTHWDAFAGNTVRPGGVLDAVAELAVPSLHILLPARNVEVVLAPFR